MLHRHPGTSLNAVRFTVLLALGLAMQAHADPTPPDDPYAWLEDVRSERALAWVRAHDAATAARFIDTPGFKRSRKRILEVLDSEIRVPYVTRMGEFLYNFWQEENSPQGVWRRTTLEEYRKPFPEWTMLLNLGQLGRGSGLKRAFRGAQCLPPKFERCLVSLSPGGGDAIEIHEFDLRRRSFVDGGFDLPLARSRASWIDLDTLFVATDFGPGSLTRAGYPRIVKQWKRATPLSAATTVFEGAPDDLSVNAWHDGTPGYARDFVVAAKDFFHNRTYVRIDDQLVRIDAPDDALVDVHRQWLLVNPHSPWTTGGTTWPAGSLLAMDFDGFMAGRRTFVPLFEPDAHTALSGWRWTQHHLLLDEIVDVQSRLEVLTPGTAGWQRAPMPATPALTAIDIVDTDPDRSDEYWLGVTGFTTPTALQRGDLADGSSETLKHQPDFFGTTWYDVSQHFADSADGTKVPYFQIAPRGMKADGSNRTLLYGYGGFEASQRPAYNGVLGREWLQRGGVFVVANIRGGGEYGPDWHKAALLADRHRAFEDFAAVARDLIHRGVTSPHHLGAEGGSNGGLLIGNMLTTYPQLFGALVSEFPLLDMRRYTHLAAGASWLAEFGDPDGPDWNYLKTYSPYENLRADAHYPPVLFYTATSDDRVSPAHARKMVAKMEAMGLKDVWFYESLEGGHGAGIDDKQEAAMRALVYGFLWTQLQ